MAFLIACRHRIQPPSHAGVGFFRLGIGRQPTKRNVFFRNNPPPLDFFLQEAAESRLTQLHEGSPGLAWWRDRAIHRKSTPGACTTGPVSQRATSAPSHRADEPPDPQAPGKQARLIRTYRTDRPERGARM